MSQNNNQEYIEDTIDLRELILSLWRHKILIIIVTLAVTIGAFGYSFSQKHTTYSTRMDIVINIPSTIKTEYSEYPLNIKRNPQYIELIKSNAVLLMVQEDLGLEGSINSLKSRISYTSDTSIENNTTFVVNVSGSSSKSSHELALSLYDNFYEYVDVYTKESATTYFINLYELQLKNATTELSKERLDLEFLLEARESNQDQSATIIESITNNINRTEQAVHDLEVQTAQYATYLDQLGTDKANIETYHSTGDFSVLEDNSISIVEPFIQLLSTPLPPEGVVHDSTKTNTVIGAVAGLMLGVMVALFIEFWNNSKPKED